MGTIFDSGITLVFLLQSLGDGFISIMKAFTSMGNEEFYLIVFPMLYWCIDNSLGLRMGIILMISGIINSYFKWSLHLPRPFWYSSDVEAQAFETSFGAPSGHSQNAVAVWGLVAATIRKPWAWTAATLLIFVIGISRIALGVHFYLDVLLGWLIGIVILLAFLRFEVPLTTWLQKKTALTQLGLLFMIAIGSLLLGTLIQTAIGDWQIPADWMQNAILAFPDEELASPFSMSGIVSNAAVLFGLGGGVILMNARGGFSIKAPGWKLVARYVIGIIGVLLIWRGLDLVFPDGHDLVAYLFRFIRYGLAGVWMSLGAPWVFVKVNLAEPATK